MEYHLASPLARRLFPWSAIGFIAFFIRYFYLRQAATSPLFDVLQGDAESYDRWARSIASGDFIGTETFYQAPLYPYFVACLYAVTDGSVAGVRYAQAFLGACSCVFLGKTAERWFDRRIGLITAAILALQPTAIFFDGIIQKTSLETFLTTGFLALIARGVARPDRAKSVWGSAGFALGLLCLARENALIWAPIAIGAATLSSPGATYRRRAATASCCLAGLLIPLSITAVRNYHVGGEAQLTTSQFGSNFYIGNHAGARGVYEPLRPHRGMTRFERVDAVELAEAAKGRKLTAGEVSDYWSGRAWSWISEHPGDWFRLLGRKVRLTFYAVEIGDTEDQYAYADSSGLLRTLDRFAHFGVLAPLAVVGLAATWPNRRRLIVPYLLIVSYSATTTLFYVFSRYRFPIVLLLIPFAAAGLATLYDFVVARRYRAAAPFVAIALVTAALVNQRIGSWTPNRFAAMSYFNLSAALSERGDPSGARNAARLGFERDEEMILEFAETLANDPAFDLGYAFFSLGESYLAQGRKEAAIDAFRQAARRASPESETAERARAALERLSATKR